MQVDDEDPVKAERDRLIKAVTDAKDDLPNAPKPENWSALCAASPTLLPKNPLAAT